jgi:sortase (surface protein transpeptidase)
VEEVRRVFVDAAFRLNISGVAWTTWLGWILTVVAVTVTASLSFGAFQAEAVSALGQANIVQELASAEQIDQSAYAKYQAEQAAKRAAAEAAAQAAAQSAQTTSAARLASTTRTTAKTTQKSAAAPTCDRLIIPKINLSTCLATVGLTADGAVDVHASLPAWFNQSSRAGTSSGRYSATFVDGHRSGIFRNLGRLAVGDKVTIAFRSGESYTYTVRAAETTPYAQIDMRKALSIYGGAAQGLTLMTCDGAYSSSLGTSESRLTIYATK